MLTEVGFRIRADEMYRLGDNACAADFIRHFKEVMRETAKVCVEIIKERKTHFESDKLFGKYKDENGESREPTTAEFADEVSRSILNTFLS